MSVLARIDLDLKAAMKNSDSLRLSVLRMAKSALKYRQIEKGDGFSEDDVASVLATLVKQRRESVEQYEKGGRQELADKERQEIAIIQEYLPAQLSAEELDSLIRSSISESGAKGEADLGKVMKILAPRTKGLADGKLVNARVRELLSAASN